MSVANVRSDHEVESESLPAVGLESHGQSQGVLSLEVRGLEGGPSPAAHRVLDAAAWSSFLRRGCDEGNSHGYGSGYRLCRTAHRAHVATAALTSRWCPHSGSWAELKPAAAPRFQAALGAGGACPGRDGSMRPAAPLALHCFFFAFAAAALTLGAVGPFALRKLPKTKLQNKDSTS
ncbi:hypothetical protein HPB48_013580 [Haemaphysalis longicornis]|uniref:Uncharacterized protein n=1 Tax=Haemaphysalis longicornis TaxID=44386 RepID=A0A9J6H3S0_HAELO|nr:hypothetical protein HPB48_013580 [Haemaphysalis longicornis]